MSPEPNDLELDKRSDLSNIAFVASVFCVVTSAGLFITEAFLSSYEEGHKALLNDMAILGELALALSLLFSFYGAYHYQYSKRYASVKFDPLCGGPEAGATQQEHLLEEWPLKEAFEAFKPLLDSPTMVEQEQVGI